MNIQNDRRMLKIIDGILLAMTVTHWGTNEMKATPDGVLIFSLFIIVNLYLFLTKESKPKTPVQ